MAYSDNDLLRVTSGYKDFITCKAQVFNLVHIADIDNINYVTGCEGKVKELIEYLDVEKTKLITRTVFKYTDALYPKTPTEKLVYNI